MLSPCGLPFSTQDINLLDVKLRCVHMKYYEVMRPYLFNLGLHHVVDIVRTEKSIINASLIAGLVERWRPETHTFHMPFGDMTVTLQDVSALWGLSIRGTPVGGVSDSTRFAGYVEELLGADPSYIIGEHGRSKFYLRMTRLRQHFIAGLSADSTELEIQR